MESRKKKSGETRSKKKVADETKKRYSFFFLNRSFSFFLCFLVYTWTIQRGEKKETISFFWGGVRDGNGVWGEKKLGEEEEEEEEEKKEKKQR